MSEPGPAAARRPKVDRQNPFPGLDAFREEDREFFYGRDDEAEELLRRVRRSLLTVCFGTSGLGKSSLLQAGLFPRLRAAHSLPVLIRLDYGEQSGELTAQVRRRVGEEVDRHRVEEDRDAPGLPAAGETLWETFHRTRFWNEKTRLLTPVLVFDQFEEIFTLGRADPRAGPLLTALADLIENRIPESWQRRLAAGEELPFAYERVNVKVVLALREDFLPQLEELAATIPSLATNRFRLTRMNGLQALEAVAEPGSEIVDPQVAREIVRFAAGAGADGGGDAAGQVGAAAPAPAESAPDDRLARLAVEPALLSLFSRELNLRRIERNLPKITGDLLEGARSEIVSDFYRRSVHGLPRAVGRFIEGRLLTAGGFRTAVALDDALGERGVTREAIDRLVDRRLLRLEERLGIPHVELIHDVLCPAVYEVGEREAARRRRRRTLAGAAIAAALVLGALGLAAYFQRLKAIAVEAAKVADEERSKAEESLTAMVLAQEGERSALQEAETQRDDAKRQRDEAVQAREDAVRAGDEADRERRRAEGQQRLAFARQLAAQGAAATDGSGDGAVHAALLAVESLETAWTFSGHELWTETMNLLPQRGRTLDLPQRLEGHPRKQFLEALFFSAGGERLLVLDAAGVWSWDWAELRRDEAPGEPRRWLEGPILDWDLSADGRRLVTLAGREQVNVFDLESGTRLLHPQLEGWIDGVAITPDGVWIAIAQDAGGGKTHLWRVDEKREVTAIDAAFGIYKPAFSPDGRWAAFALGSSQVAFFPTSSWEPAGRLETGFPIRHLAFGPESRVLAMGGPQGCKWATRDGDAWSESSLSAAFGGAHCEPAFSRDGGRLVTS